MRYGLLLVFAPISLPAADLRADHFTACGADVKSMQAKLASIGIQSEYGGPHSNHASEMALTSFPDGSYLELIAIQPKGDPQAIAAHEWSKQMQRDAGPCAWAARSNDVGAELNRLKAAGIAVSAPERSGRYRPDGTRLDWETAQVGKQTRGTYFPFLIRDFSARDWRAFPSGKPTTTDMTGVAKIVVAVRDLAVAADQYRKAYELGAPEQQADAGFGANLAFFPGTPVVLASPINAQSWLTARLNQFGEGPCAFVLSARKGAAYQAASKTTWFGASISWFDTAKLGWRLGFE
jgi:hypothetical protein